MKPKYQTPKNLQVQALKSSTNAKGAYVNPNVSWNDWRERVGKSNYSPQAWELGIRLRAPRRTRWRRIPLPFYFLSSSTPFHSTTALLLRLYVHFGQHCTNSTHSTDSTTPSLARTATSSQTFSHHTNPYPKNQFPVDYDRRKLPIPRTRFVKFLLYNFATTLLGNPSISDEFGGSGNRESEGSFLTIDPVMQPLEMSLLHGIFDWECECEKLSIDLRGASRGRMGALGREAGSTWHTRVRHVSATWN